jgi:hypothetical protein
VDDSGAPDAEMWKDIEKHHETTIKIVTAFMKHVQPFREAGDKVLETVKPPEGFQAGAGGGGFGGGGSSMGGGFGGGSSDFGSSGGDEFGMGTSEGGSEGGGLGDIGGGGPTGSLDDLPDDESTQSNDKGNDNNLLGDSEPKGKPGTNDMPMPDIDDGSEPGKGNPA